MERALIIGCGYTGQALARRLVKQGVDVTGTTTGPAEAAGVRLREVDLLRDASLELPEAAGAVVYYMVPTLARQEAGRPHIPPMERCLAAVGRQPVRGVIYLSSTSVYGDPQGAWVDESSPVAPRSPWGRMRVELEQAVASFGRARGVPACVVRLPEIYGPGRGPVERLRRGYVLRRPHRYSNRIYIDDLVTVLHVLGERLDAPLLLVADNEPATSLEVYTYTAQRLGLELTVDEGPAEGDANRRALVEESKRCRNTALLGWLGRPLGFPSYRDGITAILAGLTGPI
jgi:nucleoside-diphosphate-sugar epimerase